MLVIETPLAAFMGKRLAWLTRTHHLIGPTTTTAPAPWKCNRRT